MSAETASYTSPLDPAKAPFAEGQPPGQPRCTRVVSDASGPDSHPVRDCAVVTNLVSRARNGDQRAWDALVERYTPLIWSICRRHQLCVTDAEDVGQSVWLHLVDQLDRIRDPAALPGWLATTTRRECTRVLRIRQGAQTAGYVPEIDNIPVEQARTAEHELLVAERHAALREALMELSPVCRQLMAMLAADPPVPYAEISVKLGIRMGSIGPTRARCLDRLRQHPAITALIDADSSAVGNRVSPTKPGRTGQGP